MADSKNEWGEGLQAVDIDLLVAHPKNRPFSLTSPGFKALVESVRSKGVMTPLIARPCVSAEEKEGARGRRGEGKKKDAAAAQGFSPLQILSGHRRHEAARRAGLAAVPVIVRAMDDKEAVELLICENAEREDVSPLDEAAGIEAMIEVGWDVESIAQRMGMTPATVARRRQLQHLLPSLQKAIVDPKHELDRQIPVSVLERLARLTREAQAKLYKEWKPELAAGEVPWGLETVDSFKANVERDQLRALSGAPFKASDATLLPAAGACDACPKRTGAQPLLWEGDSEDAVKAKPRDRCLDPVCYAKKCELAAAAKVTAAKAECPNLVVLTADYDLQRKGKFAGCPIKPAHAFERAKQGDKAAVPAIRFDGSSVKREWVKPYRYGASTSGTGRTTSARTAEGKPVPTPLKTRRAELDKRRKAMVVDAVRERVGKLANGKGEFSIKLLELGGGKKAGGGSPLPHALQLIAITAVFGTSHRHDGSAAYGSPKDGWTRVFDLLRGDPNTVGEMLYRSVLGVLEGRLGRPNNERVGVLYAEAEQCCKLLGEDIDVLWQEAVTAIPEPKSWANLNADGTVKKAAKKKEGVKGRGGERGKKDADGEGREIQVPVRKGGMKIVIETKHERGKTWHATGEIVSKGVVDCRIERPDPEICYECEEDAVLDVLHALADHPQGSKALVDLEAFEREYTKDWKCQNCGCTNENGCPAGCYWVAKNLCSECVG